LPLRRMMRARGNVDWASLIGAFLVALVAVGLLTIAYTLSTGVIMIPNPFGVIVVALLMLIRWALYAVMLITLIYVILSWVNPYAPMAPAVGMLVEPLLAPLRRILPRIGGLDLSPLALLLLGQIVLMLVDGAARVLPGV